MTERSTKHHWRWQRFVLVLAAVLAVLPGPAALAIPSGELIVPSNLEEKDFSNKIGLEFCRTSGYRKEFQKAISDARAACLKAIAERKPGDKTSLAIVSDIDETLLDNREYFEKHNDFDWDSFVTWMDEARAPVLKPTADFLSWARKQGIAIFLVTGRPEENRRSTIENLIHAGFAYDGLYLRPEGDKRSAIAVKSEIRKKIEDLGFKIVVNIGDQYSDLAGGYCLDCEKLPNKLYLVK